MEEKELVVTVKDGLRILRLNRPRKKNAITGELLIYITDGLLEAANDPDTVVVALTGTGDYFTSGNDLSNFSSKYEAGSSESPNMQELLKQGSVTFNRFIKAFIDFPKPLVAVVNGPAMGVGVTLLGLCDVVYASDRATFHTPFASLGQSPEGCSSYIFPKLMGHGKAAEILMFGKKITASEAYERGLVTEVFHDSEIHNVWPRLHEWAKMPKNTLFNCKNIMKQHEKEILHKINDAECDTLMKCWSSDEFFEALMKFYTRSKM